MNFYNPKDATLNKLYWVAEHQSALGCIGNNSVNRLIPFEIPRDLSPYRFTAEKKIIKPNDESVILLSETPNVTVEEIENIASTVLEKDIDRINSESETEVCSDDTDTDVEFDEDGNPLVGATILGYTFSNFSNHYSYVYLTFFLEQPLPDIEENQQKINDTK